METWNFKALDDVLPIVHVDSFVPFIASRLQNPLSSLNATEQLLLSHLDDKELKELAIKTSEKPPVRISIQKEEYSRNFAVQANAKRWAKGICQLCENEAPFKNHRGEWYLECHHIVWLSQSGEDSIENTVALCPNCHRKMHELNNPEDVKHLKSKVKQYLSR